MCRQDFVAAEEAESFGQLAQMLDHIFHFEFHRVAEALKNAYAAIDPDADTRASSVATRDDSTSFVDLLDGLLEKANYERVTAAELSQALTESSLFDIRLHVDFSDFSEVLLFTRGESVRQETLSRWFGLIRREIEFVNYERVVVYLRIRDDYPDIGRHVGQCRSGATLLKLFRDVPKADLEMLFPNTQVRMRLIDKLMIGVPAVISGGIVLTTKVGASLVLLGSLLGYWLGLSSQPVELNYAGIMVLLAGICGNS